MSNEDLIKLELIAQIEQELRKMNEENLNSIKNYVEGLADAKA